MNLGRYRLDEQLGAGRDGVAYAAFDEDTQQPCEVRVPAAARADAARWPQVVKRLKHALLVRHPRVRPFQVFLEAEPPFVVLDGSEGTTPGGTTPSEPPRWTADMRQSAVLALTEALASAQRMGFVHGDIAPSRLHRSADGAVALDFTGLDCRAAADDSQFAAPEVAAGKPADAASDVFSLGQLIAWLTRGAPVPAGWNPVADAAAAPFDRVIARMVAVDPNDRPSATDILSDLQLSPTPPAASLVPPEVTIISEISPHREAQREELQLEGAAAAPRTLGRFRLLELVGEGGLGQVYRGEDVTDGAVVAVKVLHRHLAGRATIMKRFEKEARLLGEIKNPYVANLIEVNQEAGIHYLALEFIDGMSVSSVLRDRRLSPDGRWPESPGLALAIGVTRALADAHRRGIIHRDIKPQNIMLLHGSWLHRCLEERGTVSTDGQSLRDMPADIGTKLCDFGLARHVVESDSLHMTQEGTLLGTPLYMSPEQALGTANLGPATDVYSLGATLFHVLAGKPPFEAETALALSMKHAKEAPPPLQSLNPGVSEGLARIVARCLAKKPEDRYADAGALLEDLERHARGEPAQLVVHPRLPTPSRPVLTYNWVWELNATPEQVWPYVSNTERLNRAAGVPAVQFRSEAMEATVGDGVRAPVRRYGLFKVAGIANEWQEHPFEWIEGRRLGVLREYSAGVFKWFASIVELEAGPSGGCRLTHRVSLEPRNFLGRMVAGLEVGLKGRRRVERVYRRIDAFLTGQLSGRDALDPFEEPASLSRGQRQRLEGLLDRLAARRVPPQVTSALGDYLLHAPAQEVARIRPLALARRLQLPADDLLAACLHGAREGLFVLRWDLVCPICRIPADIIETLQALQEHGHCEACNSDFALDFANSVELIFRVHPQLRTVETKTYCIGGPAHSPHVAAQVRVAAGERLELDLALAEGAYRLRGPQLPYVCDFLVEPQAPLSRWTFQLPGDFTKPPDRAGLLAPGALRLIPHRQRLIFDNQHATELVLRVERRAHREDALTAARASASALFRELFPGEVLQAGKLVNVAAVTFLAADLGQISSLETPNNLYQRLDEPRVFALLHDHFVLGDDCLRAQGGAVIKTVGETVLAVFDDETAALRGALAWHERLARELKPRWPAVAEQLRLRVGLHRGAALAATINGRLDYFGATVDQALRLPSLGQKDQLLVTRDLAAHPHFAEQMHTLGLTTQVASTELPGQSFGVLLAATLPSHDPSDS